MASVVVANTWVIVTFLEPDRGTTNGAPIPGESSPLHWQFSSDVMPERVCPASLRNPAAQQRRRGGRSRARAGRYPRLLLRFLLLAALAGGQEPRPSGDRGNLSLDLHMSATGVGHPSGQAI